LTIPTASTWTVGTGGSLNIALSSSAGDDFVVDTDKLVVSGDSGNIGIGTTDPGTNFGGGTADYTTGFVTQEIAGGTRGALLIGGTTDAQVIFGDSGQSAGEKKWAIGHDATGNVLGLYRVADANLGRSGGGGLFLDSSDNVGIGTASPDEALHVEDANIKLGSSAAANPPG